MCGQILVISCKGCERSHRYSPPMGLCYDREDRVWSTCPVLTARQNTFGERVWCNETKDISFIKYGPEGTLCWECCERNHQVLKTCLPSKPAFSREPFRYFEYARVDNDGNILCKVWRPYSDGDPVEWRWTVVDRTADLRLDTFTEKEKRTTPY